MTDTENIPPGELISFYYASEGEAYKLQLLVANSGLITFALKREKDGSFIDLSLSSFNSLELYIVQNLFHQATDWMIGKVRYLTNRDGDLSSCYLER